MKDGLFEASDFKCDTCSVPCDCVTAYRAAYLANALLPALKEQWREEMLRGATECDACGKMVLGGSQAK